MCVNDIQLPPRQSSLVSTSATEQHTCNQGIDHFRRERASVFLFFSLLRRFCAESVLVLWDSCITVWSLYLPSSLITTVQRESHRSRCLLRVRSLHTTHALNKLKDNVHLFVILFNGSSRILKCGGALSHLLLSCCLVTSNTFCTLEGHCEDMAHFVGSFQTKVSSWIPPEGH